MRRLVFRKPGHLEWEEAPDPTIEDPGQAIVRPVAAATCDLDIAVIRGLLPFEGPYAWGHEGVAEVVEIGEAVRGVAPGDLVVVPFQISCGACDRCLRGLTASCTGIPRGSMYGFPEAVGGVWGGMLSDRLRVPFADAMLVRLPDGIDPLAVASCSDNIPDGWRTVVPGLERAPGGSVLIVGGGGVSISLYAIDVALASGAASVDYLDANPKRLALAEALGATPIEGPPPRRSGRHPITVDASGDPAGLACAVRSTEPGGLCTSIGIYFAESTPMPLLEMYGSGILFTTGRPHARTTIPSILNMVADGSLHPERITSAVVDWESAPEALADPPYKLVIARDV